jgi:catechol 2,3-dioxygenase-like lactoylglutathione lyase family enzyme
MIRGIKFVNIPVRNQKEAVKFYTEKLGFRVLTDQPFDDKQRWIELTFWSDDVQATSRALKGKGVDFVMEPKTETWGTAAVFKDLDGNQFCLSSK